MTRLGAAIGLAYGLAAIVVFLSVIAIWPTSAPFEPSSAALATETPEPSSGPSPSFTPSSTPPTVTPARPSQRPTARPTTRPTNPPTTQPTPTKAPTDPPILAIQGEATFYCLPPLSPCTVGFSETGLYAAAGAELRAALGDWRGRKVTVWHGDRHVTVTLVDSMSNPDGLVDLYAAAYVLLAPLSTGVIDVEVTWN